MLILEALIYRLSGLSHQFCPHEPRLSFIYTLEVTEDWISSSEVDQFVASQHTEAVGSGQGVVTVLLTSASFPSHPQTHECNANIGAGGSLRLLRTLQVGPGHIWSRSASAAAVQQSECAGASLHLQSDKQPSGEPAQLF